MIELISNLTNSLDAINKKVNELLFSAVLECGGCIEDLSLRRNAVCIRDNEILDNLEISGDRLLITTEFIDRCEYCECENCNPESYTYFNIDYFSVKQKLAIITLLNTLNK